jgi:hypothetical protein
MRIMNFTFLAHLYNYVHENVVCLFFIVDLLPEQAMYFTSYIALVKDIAEAYGSGIAFLFLFTPTILTMVSVHQLITYYNTNFRFSGKTGNNANINNLSADKYFTSFNFFKFFRK